MTSSLDFAHDGSDHTVWLAFALLSTTLAICVVDDSGERAGRRRLGSWMTEMTSSDDSISEAWYGVDIPLNTVEH
jgi:hypothetical protein